MKYRELIEKLKPFEDDEIEIAVFEYHVGDIGKPTITNEVRFFRDEDGEPVVGIKQEYNKETFKSEGGCEFLTI